MKNTEMHIVIICDPIDKQSAGIYQYTLQLVKHLHALKTKHRFSFITLRSDYILDDIPTIPFPNTLNFLKNDPVRTFITLPKLLNKLNPDVVIEAAHFGPFNLKKSIKRITIIHDLTPILFPEFHPFISRFLQKLLLPRILKKADLIISNSENTKKDIIQFSYNTADKTHSILLGKDEVYQPTNDFEVLEKYKIHYPYILFVGTIEPRKNLSNLLNAFALFKKNDQSNTSLVLVGNDGWKNKKLKNEFEKHPYRNDILLTGFVAQLDMPAIYSHCSVFVYPSLYEGFGLPLLEAMACGAPCICSNNSSLPEVGGEAAIYFDAKNPEEIYDKLEAVLSDSQLQKELKQKSLVQAEKFSWDRYATNLLKVIEGEFPKSFFMKKKLEDV